MYRINFGPQLWKPLAFQVLPFANAPLECYEFSTLPAEAMDNKEIMTMLKPCKMPSVVPFPSICEVMIVVGEQAERWAYNYYKDKEIWNEWTIITSSGLRDWQTKSNDVLVLNDH